MTTKAGIDAQLSFSRAPGTDYTGAWLDPATLRITVVSGSAMSAPVIGFDTAAIRPTNSLSDPAPSCVGVQPVVLSGQY